MSQVEQLFLDRIKVIGEGEYTMVGVPAELIAELDRLLAERQEPTVPLDAERVERAAEAAYEEMQHPNWRAPHWEEIDDEGQDKFRRVARAAIAAAQKGASHDTP